MSYHPRVFHLEDVGTAAVNCYNCRRAIELRSLLSFGCSAAVVDGWTVWTLPFPRKKVKINLCKYTTQTPHSRVFIHCFFTALHTLRSRKCFLRRNLRENVSSLSFPLSRSFPITRRWIAPKVNFSLSNQSDDARRIRWELLRRPLSANTTANYFRKLSPLDWLLFLN